MNVWLAQNWAYLFALSILVTNIGVHILNAVLYIFGVVCCRLRCSLLASVTNSSHIFCLSGFIDEKLSATLSSTTMTTIWRFHMLLANLSPPQSIVHTTWLAISRRDYLNCEALLCMPQQKWKSSNHGMPEVNVHSLVYVPFLMNPCHLLFMNAIVDGPLCSVCQ